MCRTWKLSPNTVTQRLASLRFLYIQVLKGGWSVAETPYPKKVLRLPQILSQEEVARFIDATESPFHRVLLMTLYAIGARRAESAHLKVGGIDSQRMVVHIRGGKGAKDRDVMLSPRLLDAPRSYWRGLRRKPTEWLFPGNRWHTSSRPVTTKMLWMACQQTAIRAGLEDRNIHPHTLRHASAYYTTFQSLFILKTIGLGQVQSAAVYGGSGLRVPEPAQLAVPGAFNR